MATIILRRNSIVMTNTIGIHTGIGEVHSMTRNSMEISTGLMMSPKQRTHGNYVELRDFDDHRP